MAIADLAYLEDISEKTSLTVSGGIKVTVWPNETLSGLTQYFYDDGTPSCYKPIAKGSVIDYVEVLYYKKGSTQLFV